jgi:hypothetical protein
LLERLNQPVQQDAVEAAIPESDDLLGIVPAAPPIVAGSIPHRPDQRGKPNLAHDAQLDAAARRSTGGVAAGKLMTQDSPLTTDRDIKGEALG